MVGKEGDASLFLATEHAFWLSKGKWIVILFTNTSKVVVVLMTILYRQKLSQL
jgi:hypothetical protein